MSTPLLAAGPTSAPGGGGPDSATFLTGLASAASTSAASPRALDGVRSTYERLSVVVDNLNVKTRMLLQKERAEFLAAYRAHTYKVQRELETLRERVKEEESSQQKNQKVRRLQDDREWYRKEALSLDEAVTASKEQLSSTRIRLEVQEEDRNWLVRRRRRCCYCC